MLKIFLRIGLITLIVLFSVQFAFAYTSSYSQIFGGKITNTKASQIQEKENSGYQCDVRGTTITIRPVKGPETYLIPFGIQSKTGRNVATDKWIMGKYSGTTTVTCKKQCGETQCTDTVDLNTISLFGNS